MSASSAVERFVTQAPNGECTVNLLVDGMHCPSCVAAIESALNKLPEITVARLNLSTKRLKVNWKGTSNLAEKWISVITGMGYRAVPFDPATSETQEMRDEKFLLRCLAVAGFASGNLMLFSVPLWMSDNISMGDGTRTLFHWIQALIAIPAIAYCGRPFYRSAWRALKHGRTNMDVPISVAVILATGMSLFETSTHGSHSYFDSGVMLLFFLLIGRYLEARAKGRARGAAHDLLQMMTGTANELLPDGTLREITLGDIKEGMLLRVAPGEKIGADGEVIAGMSELDTSLITGETLPRAVSPGEQVFAGTMNLASAIDVRVTRATERSLISEIIRLMEVAEQSQARYVTLADRISHWYTPTVHALAAITFAGWFWIGNAPWQEALLYAATVLIITCPCALGLAVPVVQVLASGKLMRKGILLKSGSALERLAPITHAIFDKTGTLTLGAPQLVNVAEIAAEDLQLAASLAAHSRHPLSKAVVAACQSSLWQLHVEEVQGCGLQASWNGMMVRLGKRSWCTNLPDDQDTAMELWLQTDSGAPVRFIFRDTLRSDAAYVIAQLNAAGVHTLLLSGDRAEITRDVAAAVGIADARGNLSPVEKTEVITSLKQQGAQVLMVGDGLNDAPSLASANVSMSPASAIDITQNAADIVFQGQQLSPVLASWRVAKFSQILVRQNFMLAIGYNVVAIPMAVAGYVTPLIAAIAMSSSSLVVIANAMRLNGRK